MIEIPVSKLNLVSDVDFLIITDHIPTFLSMRDMLSNGFKNAIQYYHIRLGENVQRLEMTNVFLIRRRATSDVPSGVVHRIGTSEASPYLRSPIDTCYRAVTARSMRIMSRRRHPTSHIRECKNCCVHTTAPRRFKRTVGLDDFRFKHTVQLDTTFLHE